MRRPAEPPELSPEATQVVAEILSRLQSRIASTPGLTEELMEMTYAVSAAYGHPLPQLGLGTEMLKQVLGAPLPLDAIRTALDAVGRHMIEKGIAIGREETLREYALEALGGLVREDLGGTCGIAALGNDTELDDADFEEA